MGINPPGIGGGDSGYVSQEKASAMQGVQLTVGQWADDPHGVGEDLAGKRRARNCWNVDQRLFLSVEERMRSGVSVRELDDGSEALDGDVIRPWA